jgi:hypothetical protein
VFLTINGQRQYLWRAVDQDGTLAQCMAQPLGAGGCVRKINVLCARVTTVTAPAAASITLCNQRENHRRPHEPVLTPHHSGHDIPSAINSPAPPAGDTICPQDSRSSATQCSPASGLARVCRMANPLTPIPRVPMSRVLPVTSSLPAGTGFTARGAGVTGCNHTVWFPERAPGRQSTPVSR